MNATVNARHARYSPPTAPGHVDRDTWAAWACLVVATVAFVLALVVGEGLSTWLGWDGAGPSVWFGGLSLVVAPVVFGIPAVLATWWWWRAHRWGDDRAGVPAAILVVLSLGFTAMALLAWVLDVVARNF